MAFTGIGMGMSPGAGTYGGANVGAIFDMITDPPIPPPATMASTSGMVSISLSKRIGNVSLGLGYCHSYVQPRNC